MARVNSIKLYEGPSNWDGKTRIFVVLTGLAKKSANTKTGDMLQTWILLKDTEPHLAIKTGADSPICGNCELRPFHYKAKGRDKPCYVTVHQAPLSVYRAHKDKPVTSPEVARAMVAGRLVRRGSYGDPGMVPLHVWENLEESEGTGYSRQWEANPGLASHVMASVQSETERDHARSLGFRTFRIIRDVSEVGAGEVLCPASKEAGALVQCAKCNLCNGSKAIRVLSKREDVYDFNALGRVEGVDYVIDWGPEGKRKSVAIVAH